jgi:hypothetical protein
MMPYRYDHFDSSLVWQDLRLRSAPGPGDLLPPLDLVTTEGQRVRSDDFAGRPLFLTFGTITCPMTATAGPVQKRLFREYGDRVRFLTVYVREAHPGERYPQPSTMAQKVRHAAEYKRRDEIPWTVAVDDIEGSLHQAIDPKPNSGYFVDGDGLLVFRVLWSNHEAALREGLERLTSAGTGGTPGERQSLVVPMLSGIGAMDETLSAAGPSACRDFQRAMPLSYQFARLAGRFRGLPPLGRAFAAGTAAATAAGALGTAAWWALGPRPRTSRRVVPARSRPRSSSARTRAARARE